MNILNIGHVCIDKSISEKAQYTLPGSPAMFMNKIFGQLPDNTFTIVAPYGIDYLQYLEGIKIYPERPTAEKTLVYENTTLPGAKRTQKAYNREFANPVQLDENFKKLILDNDIIIISPLLPNFSADYLKEIRQTARKDSLIMLLPQGYFRNFDQDNNVIFREFKEVNDILPFINIMTISNYDYPEIDKLAQEWVQKNEIQIVETMGEKGAMIISKDGQTLVTTTPLRDDEVIDSVGCGDTFSAGLAYWYKKSGNLEESVKFGHGLARQKLFYTIDKIKIDYDQLISRVRGGQLLSQHETHCQVLDIPAL